MTATSKFKALFNRGLSAIEDQAQVIERETESLLTSTTDIKKAIDTAVKDWEQAKEATGLAQDNLTWLKIEIEHKTGHSFAELEELYSRYDSNERDKDLFNVVAHEKERPTLYEVESLTDSYQDVLNAYSGQIEALEALIEEHGSESMQDELLELVAKYHTVLSAQKEAVNSHLATYEIKPLVR